MGANRLTLIHTEESPLDLVERMKEYLVSESLMSMQGDLMKDP